MSREYREQYVCKLVWSKDRAAKFLEAVIRWDAAILQTHYIPAPDKVMRPRYTVNFLIAILPSNKEAFEQMAGVKFSQPSVYTGQRLPRVLSASDIERIGVQAKEQAVVDNLEAMGFGEVLNKLGSEK